MHPVPAPRAVRTWTYGTPTVAVIGFAAAFMLGIAILIFCLPLIVSGDPGANWFLALVGVVMLGFATFMTFGAIALARTRIRLAGTVLSATVPDGHNAFLVPHFRTIRLDVVTLHSVERRDEITVRLWMSMLRTSLSVVTDSGERIGLASGSSSYGASLPIDEIGAAIAAAAGLPLTDDGLVRTRDGGLYGAASSSWTERPLEPAAAGKARRAAVLTLQVVMMLFMLTIVLRACS